ncbi:NUDIX hydrolase [Pseudoalteromonas ruthenica]|uniref:NUDIX hydrolase n=1 Tax=Pseudoalteromonas ruthenica TaxID=151081 RepID=UPI0012492180|nr:CoA pyrophosphatase [Pseudoalteromonas ruthenica]
MIKSPHAALSCAQVIARFNLSAAPSSFVPIHPKRRSAVVMLLSESEHGAQVLLCKRGAHLRHHPSQLCFPGGKQEREDKTLAHTALRELHEELNIDSKDVTIIGRLDEVSTLNDMSITPYLAQLRAGARWQIDQNEVEAAFFVPLAELLATQNWQSLRVERQKKTSTFAFLKPLMVCCGEQPSELLSALRSAFGPIS